MKVLNSNNKKMKKFFFVAASLLTGAMFAQAQSLDEIKIMVQLGQNAKARPALDKFLSDPKNAQKAEAWYYKGRVYNSLTYDTTNKDNLGKMNMKAQAYDAFRKTQDLDKKDAFLKDEEYLSYLDLYWGFYDLGAKFFNAKDFNNSFESFKSALNVHDYIISKGYTYKQGSVSPMDTALIMNIGAAATQAKREADALPYYNKIVDANIGGKDYLDIYQYLATYYTDKNDVANLTRVLDAGRKVYPQDNYWNLTELDMVRKANDKKLLFAKYEEMITKYPKDFTLHYNYAVDMFNVLNAPPDSKVSIEGITNAKLEEVAKKAIALDDKIDATLLMANQTYNLASNELDKINMIKGKTPADLKKKKDMEVGFRKMIDVALPYAEAVVKYYEAQPSLKPGQKVNYNQQLEHLAELYKTKGDLKKSAEYKKKVNYNN